ncbi:hypothetical protein I8X65_00026715 [Escherichia coli]
MAIKSAKSSLTLLIQESEAAIPGYLSGTKIWLVAGITDMRMASTARLGESTNGAKDPMSGHVFIFRRSGSHA